MAAAPATKKRRPEDATSEALDLIKLQVGHQKELVTRATLLKYPDSVLGRMFSKDWAGSQFPTTDDGAVFLDRDPDAFRGVLSFLRTGCVPTVPNNEALLAELDYWGFHFESSAQLTTRDSESDHENTHEFKVGASKITVLETTPGTDVRGLAKVIGKVGNDKKTWKADNITVTAGQAIFDELEKLGIVCIVLVSASGHCTITYPEYDVAMFRLKPVVGDKVIVFILLTTEKK